MTRAELVELTGMGRSTLSQRLDTLESNGLVVAGDSRGSTGGRRPQTIAFNPQAGVVLAADLGATHSRLGITDLAGTVIREEIGEIAIAEGPNPVLGWLEDRFEAMLEAESLSVADVRGVGVGLPGPVEFATGTAVAPPIMPGWDGYGVASRLREKFGVRVLVDNDVNVMGVGEHWTRWRSSSHLLFVKVGTGIGCGIISEGHLLRGAQGAAGDIGHVRVSGHDDVLCRCGNYGCLEAVAGGQALASQLQAIGFPARNSRDVVAQVRSGNPEAVALVRQAGRGLGEVLATAVNLFNPNVIVIGGDLAHADDALLASVREVTYQRSTPLSTREIRIVRSQLDDRAGVIGAAIMTIEAIFEPAAVDRALVDAA